MPSPILARADALMQRRRPNADSDDVPVLTDAVDPNTPEADDIPVLFDVEATASRPPATAPLPPDLPPDLPRVAIPEDVPFPTLNSEAFVGRTPAATFAAKATPPAASREDIARAVARRVEQRLAAELPRLIAAAVADYLAEQDNAR